MLSVLGRLSSARCIVFLFLFCSLAIGQQAKVLAPHDPVAPKIKKQVVLSPGAGSVFGGPWMVDANFKSSIYLKNIVETSSVTVSPVLYLSNGTRYQLPVVQLEPSGTAIVDINSSLQNLGIAPYATLSGWVELQYKWPWPPLCAVLRIINPTQSLIYTFGFETADAASSRASGTTQGMQPGASQVIEGMWWKQEPGVTGFITLANTTSQTIAARVQIADNHAAVLGTHSITISPDGMKTVNLQELQATTGTEGGLRITYVGTPDDLLINGGLQDAAVGYSANLRFAPKVRPLPPMSHATVQQGIAEVGLMTGPADPMMRFPAGTVFTPYSVLHNASAGPIPVTPTLWYMQAGAPASVQLPPFTVLPSETRSLDLPALLRSAGLQNFNGSFNLVFDTQGNPGLLIAGGSVDQTNTYVFEVAARGIAASAGKSLSYWSTGNGDDTMVTLWNPADEAQNFVFRVMFAGGHYELPIQLGPRATRVFNISQIIATQVPDAQGNIIPANIQEGSAKIVGSQADNQHILLVMDSGVYNVQKATCGETCQNCDGATGFFLQPDPFELLVLQEQQGDFWAQWCSGSQFDLTNQSNWSSSNTSVATVQTGLTHGVNAGSFVIGVGDPTEPICAPQCNPYGSCPGATGGGGSSSGTVEIPYDIQVNTDVQETINCGSNPSSLERQITYNVLDTTGTRMQFPFNLRENVPTNITSSCNQQIVHTGATCTTNTLYEPGAAGEFTDVLFPGCPSSSGVTPCGYQFANQQWQWCPDTGSPTSIGTVGPANVENTLINVDGNILGFTPGTTFGP